MFSKEKLMMAGDILMAITPENYKKLRRVFFFNLKKDIYNTIETLRSLE